MDLFFAKVFQMELTCYINLHHYCSTLSDLIYLQSELTLRKISQTRIST